MQLLKQMCISIFENIRFKGAIFMMNAVWGVMVISGLIVGMINGQGGALIDSMITGCGEAVTLCLGLAGAYMLWMGIMEVLNDMGVIDKLARFINPAMKRLFPNSKDAVAPITLNLAANFFGMGSAATPFGLEAMQRLDEQNGIKGTATNDMCMFIALNASALELLPTGVLAMRAANGSYDPYCIVLPTAIASVASFVSAILLCKLFEKCGGKKCS